MCSSFNELEALCCEEKFDFLCLAETHLTENIGDSEISLRNYNIIRCDSISRHTGGVCFYLNVKWQYKIIDCHSIEKKIWWLKIEIRCESDKHCLVGVYRSPNRQTSPEEHFINFYEQKIENISENESILITGDFNIDWLKANNHKKRLEEIISDNYLKQIVTQPTRITNNTSTLIDYAVTNIESMVARTNYIMKISDHESIELLIPSKANKKSINRKYKKILQFNNTRFRNNFLRSGIHNLPTTVSASNFANILVNSINNSLNPMIVSKNIQITNNTKQWFNNNLKEMKKMKIHLYNLAVWFDNDYHWENYNILRNEYTSELEKAKGSYINNKVNECTNQKDMWRTIKELVLKKDETQLREITINGKTISKELEMAEELNTFFVNSVLEIANSIQFVNYENLIDENPQYKFKFELLNISNLKETMKNMNNKKDHNFLTVKMLLDNFDVIGPHLHRMIIESFQTGIFPDSLKESCVVPIQKVKNTKNPNEIRPVNMLSTISKIMEKIVQNQLNKYFEKNNLLYEAQSGFRKNHSCESLLNLVVSQWKMDIARKNCVIAVFIDLKRAFETVNRDILIQKLEKYGVKDIELKWFQSYLSNRTQKTKCGNYISTPININVGVPQGAVLGTLLFLIYINDMQKVLNKSKVCMFADDALVYICGKDADECVQNLNEEMKNFEKYLKMNKLKINTSKTKAMILNGNTTENIYIEGDPIEIVKEIKYLGILIDNKLKFDLHFDYICKKISKKIGFLRRIRYKLSTTTAINIYNTTIKPHFEYCSTLLFLGSQAMKARLQKLQNKGMRCILRCHQLTHIREMLTRLQWLSVNQRLVMNALIFIFKIKNGLLPKYIRRYLVYVSDVQPYFLRNENDFRLNFSSTNFCQNLLFYNGLKLFNEMPENLKCENNFFIFKRNIISYVKQKF